MTNLLALRHRIRAAKPTACKALNPRKGDAASVRRQSRQRLRSKRRYRRNRSVRFIGTLYEPEVPSRDCTPRALPRAARSGRHVGLRPPRNDKLGGHQHFNDGLCWSTVLRRARLSAPLQGAAGSLAKLSTFHFLFSTRRMPSPYNAPSMPPPFPSDSSHTCFASSTARGRRIIPVRPNRR